MSGSIGNAGIFGNDIGGAHLPPKDIYVASDFPTTIEANRDTGRHYLILAIVTDNDPTKTNTGQSFSKIGEELIWNVDTSLYVQLGSQAIWLDDGVDVKTVTDTRNIDLQKGGLKDDDVLNEVALGDASNIAPNTTNKSLIGSKNSIFKYGSSSGVLTGGAISDAGGGNVDVAAGNGLFRITDAHTGILVELTWPQTLGLVVPSNTIRDVGVEYNAGSPQIVIRVVAPWNAHTEFPLGCIVNEAGTIHFVDNPWLVANADGHAIERFYETQPWQRANRLGGLIIGEIGTRNVTLTAGEIYDRTNEFSISALNTSVSGSFDSYLGLTLSSAANTQWDNLNYNNSGVLTALGPAKWGVLWWYIEADDDLVMVYDVAEYNNAGVAILATVPSTIPLRLQAHGKIIGRTIFQQNAATGTFQTVFDESFSATMATDHLGLSNLTAGDAGHTQFAMLGGRPGGQNLIGGSGASEKLILESTSSVTKGTIDIKDPMSIPNATGGDLFTFGVATDTSTPRVTMKINNSGYALPSTTGSNSNGDKYVFWNKIGVFKGAIGMNANEMWFQAMGTGTDRFRFYAGDATTPSEILQLGEADIVFNEARADRDFAIRKVTSGDAYKYDFGAESHTYIGDIVLSLGTLKLPLGTTINEFSIDGTLAGDSDDAVPTEKAVKTYIDGHSGLSKWIETSGVLTPKTTNSSINIVANDTRTEALVRSDRELSTNSASLEGNESVIDASGIPQVSGTKKSYRAVYIEHLSDAGGDYTAYDAEAVGAVGSVYKKGFHVGTGYNNAIYTESGAWIQSVTAPTDIVAATGITTVMLYTANLVGRSSTAVDSIVSSIATGLLDGQILEIVGFDNTKTITFDSTTSNLQLSGGKCTLGSNDRLSLKSYNNKWVEIGRNVKNTNTIVSVIGASGITADLLRYRTVFVEGDLTILTPRDITTISTSGAVAGQRLAFYATATVYPVNFTSGTNLKLDAGADFLLAQNGYIEFMFNGTNWIETTRKDNS